MIIPTLRFTGDNGSMHFWDWRSGFCFQKEQTKAQPGSIDSEAGIFAMTFDKWVSEFSIQNWKRLLCYIVPLQVMMYCVGENCSVSCSLSCLRSKVCEVKEKEMVRLESWDSRLRESRQVWSGIEMRNLRFHFDFDFDSLIFFQDRPSSDHRRSGQNDQDVQGGRGCGKGSLTFLFLYFLVSWFTWSSLSRFRSHHLQSCLASLFTFARRVFSVCNFVVFDLNDLTCCSEHTRTRARSYQIIPN